MVADAQALGSSALVMMAALRWGQMKLWLHSARQLRSTLDTAEDELRHEQLKCFVREAIYDPTAHAAAKVAVETASEEFDCFRLQGEHGRLDAVRAVRSPVQSFVLTSLMLLPSMAILGLIDSAVSDATWPSDVIQALASQVP